MSRFPFAESWQRLAAQIKQATAVYDESAHSGTCTENLKTLADELRVEWEK